MPGKKFKAPNSKAEAARERKETAKRDVEERKKKEEEDKFWQDDDKHASRKQERKVRIFILYTHVLVESRYMYMYKVPSVLVMVTLCSGSLSLCMVIL